MAGYAELTNGRVWYDDQGSGEPLLLLHGGAVVDFLANDPVATVAPIRRASTS
jgi:hypothetical protein